METSSRLTSAAPYERSWQVPVRALQPVVRPVVTAVRRPALAPRQPVGLTPLQAQFNELMDEQRHPLEHLTKRPQAATRQTVEPPRRQLYFSRPQFK